LAAALLLGTIGSVAALPVKPGDPATAKPGADAVFGSWSLACGGEHQRCALTQAVSRDREGRLVVLGAVILQPAGSQRLRLDFRVSPQAMAKAGIGVKMGTGAEYRLPMSQCDVQVCVASGWIDGPLQKDIERNQVAQVAFLMDDRKQVLVPLSLGGLREAMAELQRRNAAGERAAPARR
jgi:invasion protein IalB